jgi:hypothetical protein
MLAGCQELYCASLTLWAVQAAESSALWLELVLAFTGNDGRFLLKGQNRQLASGSRAVSELIASGMDRVVSIDGSLLDADALVEVPKNAVPSFIHGQAVLFVQKQEGHWITLKRD